MSEKFVVTGGLSIPQGQELEIGANTLSSILTGDTLSFAEDAKKKVIPSEYSVAKYIDTQLGASNQLNFTTDSDGEFDTEIVLASETLSILGTTGEIETSVSASNKIKIGLPENVTVTGTTSIGGTLGVTGVATFTAESVHSGGIDCNGTLSMGANSIEGTADEMIISADGDETSASNGATNSLSLNASGGIFTADAVDMDSSLDVAGVTSLAAAGVLTSVRGTMNVVEAASFDATATFDVESVHSAGLAMTNSSKKDFSVAMTGSAVEVVSLTGFESGKIVLKVKKGDDITTKEILAVNGSFVEYATVTSGNEVAMTVLVSGNSVTVNSAAGGTATGSVDLIK